MRSLFVSVVSVVLWGLSGCGGCNDDDNGGRLADAPPAIDGAVDAAAPDAAVPLEPVTLTITLDGAAVGGIRVYFQNADSTLVKSTLTDATGTATAVMAAGGYVTAIESDNQLRTFGGVKPGDQLVLTIKEDRQVEFTLTLPPVDNATDYAVYTTCGEANLGPGGSDSPPSGLISLFGCGNVTDIAVIASAPPPAVTKVPDESVPVAALYHPNVTLSETVDLRNDTYEDLTEATFTYMNAPADTTVSVAHWLASPNGRLGSFDSNDVHGSVIIFEPPVPPTRAIVETFVEVNGSHEVMEWGGAGVPYALDMTGILLKGIFRGPFYSPTTRRMSWTEGTTGATPDLTYVTLSASRVLNSEETRSWTWRLVAPYTAGELTLPALPTDVFDWMPRPEDDYSVNDLMNAKIDLGAGGPRGYDVVRARMHDIRDHDFFGLVTGQSGRAVTVETSFRGDRAAKRVGDRTPRR